MDSPSKLSHGAVQVDIEFGLQEHSTSCTSRGFESSFVKPSEREIGKLNLYGDIFLPIRKRFVLRFGPLQVTFYLLNDAR